MFDGGDAKDKEDDVQEPHETDRHARVRMVGQQEGDAHERRDGKHDAELLPDGHAAPAAAHEHHRLTVDTRCAQPCIQTARAAREAECSEQDEWDGRQDREKCAEDSETEADKPERYIKNFFEDHHCFPYE